MNKTLLVTGISLGILGIVLGAFAAHGLEKLLDKDAVETFETGVRYQFYHAFLMLILGGTSFIGATTKKTVFILLCSGLLFFSGSIYGLSTNDLTEFDFKSIAFLTPLGGLLLIFGWVVMLIAVLKIKRD